jgi:hypothetical protein
VDNESNDDSSTTVDLQSGDPNRRVRIVDFAGVVNVNANGNGMETNTPFTMDQIKDAIVSEKTVPGYNGSIYAFLKFCSESTAAPYNVVLTEVGHQKMQLLEQ